ncbi:ABC transporter permease [Roseovarius sp. 2305UL8-3]|uniref:ABC transporter permease n=1 Tax=Roseovarius conchicola TaxID=3121636 RepID=UPI003529C5D4
MFHNVQTRSTLQSVITTGELIYHATVREVRKGHNNAFVALASNILVAVLFVMAFYIMFVMLGIRSAGLRGDFLLFIMSGIFLFLTHTKSLGAVVGAEGPTSAMMLHAPLNTIIAISAAALSTLYIQTLTLIIILFFYHVIFTPITIEQPIAAYGMFLLSWFSGVALGLVLLSIKPWAPGLVGVFTTVYQRASMIASGKMFVANTLPGFMIAMFDWHPLFHTIDQARGFVFINYVPRNSMWEYPLYLALTLIMIGLMGEFYTRQFASVSWNAKR